MQKDAKICKYVDFVICSSNKLANMCCKTDKMEKYILHFVQLYANIEIEKWI